ncbi:esterase/lipase superfamily enzyme [Kibdelosporangium banguiense]|uniref:Esterase/lipase superfamily enzyme n=1 Tax=Kibdelosporangium banguiense TaxID=1365924 RepID=A0ABS4U009_9PSEU|nr:alpha/beta hydrolase [Kibdelosporangium banguiense]MBP2329501.1 esterase/lipase superfamily enzyme [Kibdelosporangium banguiense]
MDPVILDLDEKGDFVDPENGKPVSSAAVPGFLASWLLVPPSATDIVVFVHGWRNTRHTAERRARKFFELVETHCGNGYPALQPWSGHYVIIRWPSMSSASQAGYRRIRDRAHAMTTDGRAADALGQLLGYLNAQRQLPGSPTTLRNPNGQYLHCVGHSFGGRFIVEAVQAAADKRPPLLGWNRGNPQYPYTVDTLLIFQMAAAPDIFTGRFDRVLHDAPINGPIVLTTSRSDRATGLWHRKAEGAPGIGHVGALEPKQHITATTLRETTSAYQHAELDQRIVNVDASWRYRRGHFWRPAGAHSDIWYPESAHLLLSLADLAR